MVNDFKKCPYCENNSTNQNEKTKEWHCLYCGIVDERHMNQEEPPK